MTSDKVNSPHDRYFKQTLSHADQARDFVLHYLPAEITLLLLKHIFSKDLTARLPDFLKLLRSLSDNESALEALEAALRYVASANDRVKAEDLIRNAKAVFHEKGGDIMPTLAEQWIEQGMQQGMEQGMQQGMQKGMEQGRKQGLHQGIEQGIQQGMEQGKKQGLHQGIQEGTLKGTRAMVAEALRTKFSTLPEEIVEKIEEIDDVDVLTKLLREAINARDMEEFKTVLGQIQGI